MSSKKVKGFFQANKERQRTGPQGGRQPKMDFKGKPMSYWKSRVTKINNKSPDVVGVIHGGNKGNIDKMPRMSSQQVKQVVEKFNKRKQQANQKK